MIIFVVYVGLAKYYVYLMDCIYYNGKLFEPAALFFHPQIWGKYHIVFYFLLSDVVSKTFLKTAVMLITVPLLILFCLFYCSSSGALSVPLLPGHWAGWRPVGRCGNGDSPVCFRGFFFLSVFTSAVTCLSLVERLWWFFKHKTAAEMSSCSLLLAPMVHRHWSITYTVVKALSCSNNVEFGTKNHIVQWICAKRLLWSTFLRAQWLLVFNAVLPLHLGC